MKIAIRELKPRSELNFVKDLNRSFLQKRRLLVALHISIPSGTRPVADISHDLTNKVMEQPRRRLSSLRGKVSKISSEEIDNRLKSLRNGWQRDI